MKIENRGRPKKELTKEQIEIAIKSVSEECGKLILSKVAEKLDVSYPTFLREKQRLGLDPKKIELTNRIKELEKEEFTEEEFTEYITTLEEKTKQTSYEEFTYKFDESIIVVFLGDSHFGSDTSRYDRFWNICKIVKNSANVKVVLLGDYIDNFGKYSPGSGVYDQLMPPAEQKMKVEWIVEYLGSDKILGVVQGCHDEWSYRNDTFDLAKYLANSIGVPYLGFHSLLKLHIGVNEYKLYVSHKDKYYARINLCHGLKRVCREEIDYDIGVSAHNHTPNIECFEVSGVMRRAMKISGYKDPDRFLKRVGYEKKPTLDMCAVFLAEKQKYRNWGIVMFEDIDHAFRFL